MGTIDEVSARIIAALGDDICMVGWRRRIEITPEQLAVMRAAGLVVAEALPEQPRLHAPASPLHAWMPSQLKGDSRRRCDVEFSGYHGYPSTICVSVNEEVVHGIPGPPGVA